MLALQLFWSCSSWMQRCLNSLSHRNDQVPVLAVPAMEDLHLLVLGALLLGALVLVALDPAALEPLALALSP